MIDKALDYICDQLNTYLKLKDGITQNVSLIKLDNIAWHDAMDDTDKDAFLSLVNIEEDRISKSQENFVRNSNGSVTYKNPKIFLNLYLLFSVNLSDYTTSLHRLSYIIQFFQYQNVFTPLTAPGNAGHLFPDGLDELIFDLHTLSFQDLNNLWGIMGSKYLPSVMYKMRLVIIDENFDYGQSGLIQRITINDKSLQQ